MPLELVKVFEHQTNRVKCLSFHPRRPLIIASLHTGIIQLWDYQQGLLLSTFSEHEGPIRSVAFHPVQNIFVSGGDDAKVKVWNTSSTAVSSTNSGISPSSRSLFTLTGHTDYIRFVCFHSEAPWILSASDDQTLRIWNWQSRQCLSILTGHTHYVMSAVFSPLGDMIASCSLDQTIRIWDITGLIRKSSTAASVRSPSSSPSSSYPDLFAPSDVMVKHIIEGHERGINSVAWHPSGQMIVSGSDDRLVKVWQIDSFRAWEIDTYSGHFNNVSSVTFAYHGDIIISNSEDRTMRVWDVRSKACIFNYRRESERYWNITGHPTEMIFAAAHDSGFSVFKLERDYPPMAPVDNNTLLYVSTGCALNVVTGSSSKTSIGILVSDEKSTSNSQRIGEMPTSISHNPGDGSLLAYYESGHVELFPNVFISSATSNNLYQFMGMLTPVLRIPAIGGVFLSRNRYVVLDSDGSSLLVSSTSDKSSTKRISLQVTCNNIFSAQQANSIYLTAVDKVYLFDIQQERVTAKISTAFFSTSPVVYCCLCDTEDFVAFGSRAGIMLMTKKLDRIISSRSVINTVSIESMAIAEISKNILVVLFSTSIYTINYILPFCNFSDSVEESGVILQSPSPVYVTGLVKGSSLGVIDSKGAYFLYPFNPSEIKFKSALEKRDYRMMSSIVASGDLIGQSMISYLCHKGHPQLALKYVKDPQTRFELAIECQDLEMALAVAQKLSLATCWERLADIAMRHGKVSIAEESYHRQLMIAADQGDAKAEEKISLKLIFLWIITGQLEKVGRFSKEAAIPPLFNFLCLLITGDNEEVVKLLQSNGQHMLAFAFGVTTGTLQLEGKELDDKQRRVLEFLANQTPVPALPSLTPNPSSNSDWPLLESAAPKITNEEAATPMRQVELDVESTPEPVLSVSPHSMMPQEIKVEGDTTEAWGIEDDFELTTTTEPTLADTHEKLPATLPGVDPIQNLVSYSSTDPVDHVVIGDFESALTLLKNRFKITSFGPLKEKILTVFATSRLWISSSASLLPVDESFNLSLVTPPGPAVDMLYSKAISLTTAGKFLEAQSIFVDALQYCALYSSKEELRARIREYILGLKIELVRRLPSTEPGKSAGLSFLFTQCDLEPMHRLLTLRSALSLAIKSNNYRMGALFARRILNESNTGLPANVLAQIQKTLVVCEDNIRKAEASGMPADEQPPVPITNSFVSGASLEYICARSLEAVWSSDRERQHLACPFCESRYRSIHQTPFVCDICKLCEVTPIKH